MNELIRTPGYLRWLTARACSWFGDTVMMLVLPMWVKGLTGSNGQAGLTFLFFVLPQLLSPLTGVLIDRWSRRWILVAGNLISALAMVALLLGGGTAHVGALYAVTFLYGVSGAVLPNASVAMMRSIVPERLLGHANGLQQTVGTTIQLAAPLLGGTLFALAGGRLPAAVALVAFGVSTLLFLAFRNAPTVERTEHTSRLAEVTAGLRHVWAVVPLRHGIVAFVIVQCFLGLLEGSIFSVAEVFGHGTGVVPVIATFQGIGALLGALASGRLIRRFGEFRVMSTSLLAGALLATALALAPSFPTFLALLLPAGAAIPLMAVAFGTLQARVTAAGLMGRVTTATAPLFVLASLLSLSVGAMLVAVLTFRPIYAIIAGGLLLAGVYLVVNTRAARRWEAQRA